MRFIGEPSTRWWMFYNDETILVYYEDGILYWEVRNELASR